MTSVDHEALVLLFRNSPELALALLREGLSIPIPAYAEARIESADVTDLAPAEARADLVVVLRDGGEPVLAIVVEVQLGRDEEKCLTWPMYAAGVRRRFKCRTALLVVTPSESVARWARKPIDLGPAGVCTVQVAGPSVIPIVRDAVVAAAEPELAVLSAIAHGKGEHGLEIALAALEGTRQLDASSGLLYDDLIRGSLGAGAARALEELMAAGNYEYQSEFARRHRAEGRADGLTEGRTEGLMEGRTEGRTEGLRAGLREALLNVLEARGLPVSEAQHERLQGCTDVDTLKRWQIKALTADTTDALFVP